MLIILRILETYKFVNGKTYRIFGLKYQNEAVVPIKFVAPERRQQKIKEITNINQKK